MLHEFIQNEYPNITENWHERNLEHFEWSSVANEHIAGNLISTCVRLHWANYQIWHHEDYCRSGVSQLIVTHKPQIDIHNQIRNDIIEELDEYFMDKQAGTGTYNTETVGSIIDRLSVLALKAYHWNELVNNGKRHYIDKYITARYQFLFLCDELCLLLDDMLCGKRQVRIFKQLKMYNNADTNPKMNNSKE